MQTKETEVISNIRARHQMNRDLDKSFSVIQDMLKQATNEGKAVAADLCSVRLDKLATHAAIEGLSAAEIVELIREEAAAITSKGGAVWN